MAKAQGKKAAAAAPAKGSAKKAATAVKKSVKAAPKKAAPKKPAAKPAPKAKVAPKKAKAPAKPVKKVAEKVKAAAKVVKKAVVKVAKAAAKPATKPAPKAAPAKPAAAKAAAAPKAAPAPKPKAVKAAPAPAPVAPNVPTAPKPPAADEKKRGRRARPRVTSSGAPAASWLSSEKPRPASFIAAPARAEAPSAIAAPPATSDRLIREEDLAHPAVRTVPVRIDVEQAAGRFLVIANPSEITLRVGEGIEWDFRYIGGADVNVEEIVIDFEKPSPFASSSFRTRKPGGARPHRQLSGGAAAAFAGKRIQYTVRAMNQFRTELANTKQVFVTITS